MSRAGQRARLDKLLELIGPKIQRIRVEGGMPPTDAPAGPASTTTVSRTGITTVSSAQFAELDKVSASLAPDASNPWIKHDPKLMSQRRAQERAERWIEAKKNKDLG
jgi:hypothetical protein